MIAAGRLPVLGVEFMELVICYRNLFLLVPVPVKASAVNDYRIVSGRLPVMASALMCAIAQWTSACNRVLSSTGNVWNNIRGFRSLNS